jgi:CDP-glucose 4,6-dehydratase
MENLGLSNDFWKNKTVFLTGHTGFKGSWLSLWLVSKGARVVGYALNPPTQPSLYTILNLDELVQNSYIDTITNKEKLYECMNIVKPDIVIHMAAQPLVRASYQNPVETYETNILGTAYILESIRKVDSVRVFLNVTTDKCYENKEWIWAYRENEPLGGYDPYSSSKACSELITAAYRNSFFNLINFDSHQVAVATARAGNVIGGGDWAKDRLIPDIIDSLLLNKEIQIRNPMAVRPWQYVLEPLSGYLLLCEKLYENGGKFSESWNFGPFEHEAKPVEWIVEKILDKWGTSLNYRIIGSESDPHEATYLKLDISKARQVLNWNPKWNLDKSLDKIIDWYRSYQVGENMREVSLSQITEYENT